MNILGIDTSSNVATVAVLNDEKLVGEYTINNPMTHSQKLMPMIDVLLKDVSLSIRDIDYLAVSKGPGSFTGIRIGIATVKGLAQPFNTPILAVSSLEVLAYNIPFTDKLICPIMDARRDEVYSCIYKWENNVLKNLIEERAMGIEKLMESLQDRKEDVIFLGDGLKRYGEFIQNTLKERAVFTPNYVSMQRAASLVQLAFDKIKRNEIEPENHFTLVPTYLRKSEAERKYEERMGKDK